MSMTDEVEPNPVAVYMPIDGLDVSPGKSLLRSAGFEVHQMHSPRPGPDTPSDAVALLAGYDPVESHLMDRFPSLRIIATHSDGYDMIDVDAAARRGIWVCNLPDSASEEVAVHAIGLTLSLLRQLPGWHRRARRGEWIEDPAGNRPRRPSNLTCGVIGLGRIGHRYATFARPFFGATLGVDPYLPDEHWPDGVERTDVDTAFATCDVISLHVPLTTETTGVVNHPRIASMPPESVLINVSRGELVDEPALLDALNRADLAGAGLDVLRTEPPSSTDPLLQHSRVLATPHVAYLSEESATDYARKPAENVAALFHHGRPVSPVVTGSEVSLGQPVRGH